MFGAISQRRGSLLRATAAINAPAEIAPAKEVFDSVGALLGAIKVPFPHSAKMSFRFMSIQESSMVERQYVDLGLHCSEICTVLDRGLRGRSQDDLGQTVCDAMDQMIR